MNRYMLMILALAGFLATENSSNAQIDAAGSECA